MDASVTPLLVCASENLRVRWMCTGLFSPRSASQCQALLHGEGVWESSRLVYSGHTTQTKEGDRRVCHPWENSRLVPSWINIPHHNIFGDMLFLVLLMSCPRTVLDEASVFWRLWVRRVSGVTDVSVTFFCVFSIWMSFLVAVKGARRRPSVFWRLCVQRFSGVTDISVTPFFVFFY